MENKKEKEKTESGFMNNVSVFCITIILFAFLALHYKPAIETCSCCDSNGTLYNYTPGTMHNIIAITLAILFVLTIICSIYFLFRKKKQTKIELFMNIIFAIINVLFVIFIPLSVIIDDLKDGNSIQNPNRINTECTNGDRIRQSEPLID